MAFIQLTLHNNDEKVLVNTRTITTIMDRGTHRTIYFIEVNDHITVKESLEVIQEMAGNL